MPRLPSALLSAMLTLGLSSQASALMFNEENVQQTDYWSSMELTLGDERLYRAVNLSDHPATGFSVFFLPNECYPQLELRVDMGEYAARDETVEMERGALRIDREPAHDSEVTLRRERGDSGTYARFRIPEPYRALHEMRVGDTLRLMLDDGEDPWYLTFHLQGASAAIDRAARMCRESLPGADEKGREDDKDAEAFF